MYTGFIHSFFSMKKRTYRKLTFALCAIGCTILCMSIAFVLGITSAQKITVIPAALSPELHDL